jgi:hypothetical membrane protein
MNTKTTSGLSHISNQRRKVARVLGAAGAVSAIFFLVVFLSLHWLDPSVNIARNYVSDYANGIYGSLFQLSLLVHGFGNLAIAGGFFIVANSRIGEAAATLFGLAAISILVASVFSTDPPGSARTIAGTLHAVAAFTAFPIESIALLVFALTFRQLPLWDSFVRPTIGAAILSITFLLWLLLATTRGLEPGLSERASFMSLMIWEILAGLRLARCTRE